jgi:peptidoglycan L-alanyl-D-glutamate endopeptidase CwlK
MSSRDPKDLCEPMQKLYERFSVCMESAGIDFICTCTRRLQSEQDTLYEQGRAKPGPIVTWTRHSKHITGEAFDIVIMENGKPDWNVTNPKWTLAGKIGRTVGLNWGGSWARQKDFPHFEMAEA